LTLTFYYFDVNHTMMKLTAAATLTAP